MLNITGKNVICVFNLLLLLFTLCRGQIVWEVGRACPSVPVRVHKLAVVLSLPKCVSYTVKGLCRGKIRSMSVISADTAVSSIDLIAAPWYVTSQAVSHEDLVSQGVTQNHAHKLPVPCPLDVLAALAAAVGRVVFEREGDPDRFSAWGAQRNRGGGDASCCRSQICILWPIYHAYCLKQLQLLWLSMEWSGSDGAFYTCSRIQFISCDLDVMMIYPATV